MTTPYLTTGSFAELAHLLPPTAHDLVKAVGVDAALKLVQHLPGVQVLVPREAGPGPSAQRRWQLLAGVVGEVTMPALAAVYGGNMLDVPSCADARDEQRNRWLRQRFDLLTGQLRYTKAHAITELGMDLAMAGTPLTYRAIERVVDQGDLTPEALAQRHAGAADSTTTQQPELPLFAAARA
jgi:hypothetical protein